MPQKNGQSSTAKRVLVKAGRNGSGNIFTGVVGCVQNVCLCLCSECLSVSVSVWALNINLAVPDPFSGSGSF